MPLRVLVAPDKFKGTLSAPEAAEAIGRGWRRVRPRDEIELLPISDGGDGFGEALGRLMGARAQKLRTVDAAHRPCVGKWWWEAKSRTAIIESATIIGLALLPPGRFHPFELDTFGLGEALRAALRKGARRCIMGIGGSATNEGGFGLAGAMGWSFLDNQGIELRDWTCLDRLHELKRPGPGESWFDEFIVAVDVSNPLLGPRGATQVYGPQKGMRPRDFERAEKCLRRLAQKLRELQGRNFSRLPGAGAAGGLGFGLAEFLGAELVPGFQLFSKMCGLERRLQAADCVVTGEGQIDRSTSMGKGVGELAKRCHRLCKPCVVFGGIVAANRSELKSFSGVHALSELTSVEEAKARPSFWLEQLAGRAAAGVVAKVINAHRSAQREATRTRRRRT